MRVILLLILVFISDYNNSDISLPIYLSSNSIDDIQLTEIGKFGLWRKDRSNVPGHLHTGIDIKRPNNNYNYEPIFSVANGFVLSKRDDGPYAQLIIEHNNNGKKFWTVYEHIAGISVSLNESVDTKNPIGRFMSIEELNKHGWQFDHFHFEVLKTKPYRLIWDSELPERVFNSYSLICFTTKDLNKYFYNPLNFLKSNMSN